MAVFAGRLAGSSCDYGGFSLREAIHSRLYRGCVSLLSRLRECAGQSTVEAAFALPLFMALVLLLLQPGILLYDRMVMQQAAAEGCRLAASSLSSGNIEHAQWEQFVRRRLSAVPQQDCFHVHEDQSCSWAISVQASDDGSYAEVTIGNKVKFLPLLSLGAEALGITDEDGCFELEVTYRAQCQPNWMQGKQNPSSLVGSWLEG